MIHFIFIHIHKELVKEQRTCAALYIPLCASPFSINTQLTPFALDLRIPADFLPYYLISSFTSHIKCLSPPIILLPPFRLEPVFVPRHRHPRRSWIRPPRRPLALSGPELRRRSVRVMSNVAKLTYQP